MINAIIVITILFIIGAFQLNTIIPLAVAVAGVATILGAGVYIVYLLGWIFCINMKIIKD